MILVYILTGYFMHYYIVKKCLFFMFSKILKFYFLKAKTLFYYISNVKINYKNEIL